MEHLQLTGLSHMRCDGDLYWHWCYDVTSLTVLQWEVISRIWSSTALDDEMTSSTPLNQNLLSLMFMIVETVQMGATLSWETERSQHFRTWKEHFLSLQLRLELQFIFSSVSGIPRIIENWDRSHLWIVLDMVTSDDSGLFSTLHPELRPYLYQTSGERSQSLLQGSFSRDA